MTGSRGSWMLLGVVLVGSFMAVLDTTSVNVALPSIAVGTGAHQRRSSGLSPGTHWPSGLPSSRPGGSATSSATGRCSWSA
ncbi:MAG TPA: hypothetical protein VFQ44_02645 [Streptosporangiaceae bacterium]|nr:hypothetical protein [Streptosporangiaceae bacterium]